MGLLTTWTDANKVTSQGLAVRYVCEQTYGYDYFNKEYCIVGALYKRVATKRYSYVGLSIDAAKACAETKKKKYTRSHTRQSIYTTHYMRWTTTATNADGSVKSESGMSVPNAFVVEDVPNVECQADITISNMGGCLWRVNISVNETDTAGIALDPSKDALEQIGDFSTLFPTQSAWDYDE